jgi:hypothetical protein
MPRPAGTASAWCCSDGQLRDSNQGHGYRWGSNQGQQAQQATPGAGVVTKNQEEEPHMVCAARGERQSLR